MPTSDSPNPLVAITAAETGESGEPASPAQTSSGTPTAETNDTDDQESVTASSSWLRRGDQMFVGLLVVAVVALMAAHWVRLSGWALLTT